MGKGVQRRLLEMKFKGVEFVVHYCATEVRVEVKMGQLFAQGKPKWNLMFTGANQAQNRTGKMFVEPKGGCESKT